MDPSGPVDTALEWVANGTVTQGRIGGAVRKLTELSQVLGMLLHGASPGPLINVLAENNVDLEGIDVLLNGAFDSLVDDAAVLTDVRLAIDSYCPKHTTLQSTPRWEAWRRDNEATTAHLAQAIRRLRDAYAWTNRSARAINGAVRVYPHLSPGRTVLISAAEQFARDATADAEAALEEVRLMCLAAERERGSARRLFEVGDV